MLLRCAVRRLYPSRGPYVRRHFNRPGTLPRREPGLFALAIGWRYAEAQPAGMVVGDRNTILYYRPDRPLCRSPIATIGCYIACHIDAYCRIDFRITRFRNSVCTAPATASHGVFPL